MITNILQALGVILLGGLAGWAVNFLADVLPLTRRISTTALCANCCESMSWESYLTFRPCPACEQPRSRRTWVVQIGFPLLFLWQWFLPSDRLGFWGAALLLVYFGVVAVIDLEYRAILDPVSYIGLGIGFGAGLAMHGLLSTIAGSATGFLIMLLMYYGGEQFSRWLSKRRGEEIEEVALGFGDVKLSGILGLILGWPGIFAGLIFGIFFGGIAGIIYIVYTKLTHRYEAFSAIPYAPFLILGALVLLLRP